MSRSESEIQEIHETLKRIYEEALPFNKLIGMEVIEMTENTSSIRIDMREDLIGNPVTRSLHGGVISSVTDVVGGLTASVGLLQHLEDESNDEIKSRFAKMGTIDLRVDYLRPGYGDYFVCSGKIMRTGKKIAVTRMEFKNDEDKFIAVGTGTYLVG